MDAHRHAHINPYAQRLAFPRRHVDANAHTDRDRYRAGSGHANSDRYHTAFGDRDPDTFGDLYRNADPNSHGNGCPHAFGDSDCHCHIN